MRRKQSAEAGAVRRSRRTKVGQQPLDLSRCRALVWHFGFSKEKPRDRSENINEDINQRESFSRIKGEIA